MIADKNDEQLKKYKEKLQHLFDTLWSDVYSLMNKHDINKDHVKMFLQSHSFKYEVEC